ncbi:MAG: DUF4286 family protein [Bacteroidia bacterium]|nr:DUF4286 family protein [Bacteroidia bacterium]
MYIYAVSVHVATDVEQEWVEWMTETHIPDVLKTGCFLHARLFKVEQSDNEGVIYSVQYTYASKDDFERYEKAFADALRREHTLKFGNRCHAFRSHAQLIHEFFPKP